MKTLELTSPYMRGSNVTRMQQAMKKHGWLQGAPDGVYGPLTGQAAHRSKYWLGYAKPDQTAGDRLLAYLEGRTPPTQAMKKRTVQRRKHALAVPVRQKALNYLTGHVGDKEHPPNSNRVAWASEWYRLLGPWCLMAVTRAYVEAGSQAFKRGQRYAYCPYAVNDAHAGRNNLALTKDPQPGDLVFYDWGQKDGISDHVGLFEKWTNRAAGEFSAVEGNTSSDVHGDQSNGGEVCRKNRSRSNVQVFVHVGK